jgi:DNA repair protein RecN (Recombination protein N)
MLVDLFIKDFVLIQKINLRFKQGLSVLTGETGAGKSILLDALSLCCGKRGDSSFIRKGAEQASLSAIFHINNHHSLVPVLKNLNLIDDSTEDDIVLHLRRHIEPKSSKAFINDIPVKLSTLKEIGDELFEINGQFDHLFNTRTHQKFLDSFIDDENFLGILEKIKKLYSERKTIIQHIKILEEEEQKSVEGSFFKKALIDDLENLDIQENEEELLLKERALIESSGKYAGTLSELQRFFEGSEFLKKLQPYMTQLERVQSEQALSVLKPLQQLESIILEAQEQTKEHLLSVKDAELQLENIDERLYILRKFAKKYNTDTRQLYYLLQDAFLASKKDYVADKKLLQDQLEKKNNEYMVQATLTSECRQKYNTLLKIQVEQEFQFLKLPHAKFHIEQKINNIEKATDNGLDDIEFFIATNKGQELTPIYQTASGGELSRVMLALKSVLSLKNGVSTLVFDEIDTGVGGAVAMAIGERLKKLSQKMQVFSVTHSPQVASFSDTHYFVEKNTTEDHTTSSIRELNEDEKTKELARMLSGEVVTENAMHAAKDLQDIAHKTSI